MYMHCLMWAQKLTGIHHWTANWTDCNAPSVDCRCRWCTRDTVTDHFSGIITQLCRLTGALIVSVIMWLVYNVVFFTCLRYGRFLHFLILLRSLKVFQRRTFRRVCTDPGKVWKVMEFNVEIFHVWKIMENDLRYGKVMESVTADLEN